MPDITSRKSETDEDRRRNEREYRRLTRGLADQSNMGERERAIFEQIAAAHAPKENKHHRAASHIFDRPAWTLIGIDPSAESLGDFDNLPFGGLYPPPWSTQPPPPVIDAPFKVINEYAEADETWSMGHWDEGAARNWFERMANSANKDDDYRNGPRGDS